MLARYFHPLLSVFLYTSSEDINPLPTIYHCFKNHRRRNHCGTSNLIIPTWLCHVWYQLGCHRDSQESAGEVRQRETDSYFLISLLLYAFLQAVAIYHTVVVTVTLSLLLPPLLTTLTPTLQLPHQPPYTSPSRP